MSGVPGLSHDMVLRGRGIIRRMRDLAAKEHVRSCRWTLRGIRAVHTLYR